MHEALLRFKTYLSGIWKYRWSALMITWLVCIAGWVTVYFVPDQYRVTTKVYIDTSSMLRPLLKGLALGSNVQQEVLFMTKTLLSRPNIEKLIRMTDLDINVKTDLEMEELVNKLSRTVLVDNVGRGTSIYEISYVNEDPQVAKLVVQSLLNIFVESSLGGGKQGTGAAREFIESQIRDYEARLEEAESKLKDFKQDNIAIMSSGNANYYERLRKEQASLNEANLTLGQAQNKEQSLKQQLAAAGGARKSGLGEDDELALVSSPLDERIRAMDEQLDLMLLQYTEKHPTIKSLKLTLEQLKTRKRELVTNEPVGGVSRSTDPYIQQLRLAHSSAAAETAATKVRVNEYQRRVRHLQKQVDIAPNIEAELKKLNRDYDVVKANYSKLVERREQALLSEQAQENAEDVKFRIIEPPYAPLEPFFPIRPLLEGAVMLLGCIAGVITALALSLIRPVFYDTRSVAKLGLPVFGSVNVVWSEAQARVRSQERILFSLAFFSLLIALAAISGLRFAGIDVVARLGDLI